MEANSVLTWRYDGVDVSVIKKPVNVFGAEPYSNGLMDDMQRLATVSFGAEFDESSQDGVREHILGADIIAILYSEKSILGFASAKRMEVEGEKIFYLHGIVIATEHKGNGGSKKLIETLSQLCEANKIALTTQNPVVFCLLNSLCDKVFPSPFDKSVPQEIRGLGGKLIEGRQGKFNPQTFVVNGLYDKCLYGGLPQSRRKEVNSWFSEALEVERGLTTNGFLFVGERATT